MLMKFNMLEFSAKIFIKQNLSFYLIITSTGHYLKNNYIIKSKKKY